MWTEEEKVKNVQPIRIFYSFEFKKTVIAHTRAAAIHGSYEKNYDAMGGKRLENYELGRICDVDPH